MFLNYCNDKTNTCCTCLISRCRYSIYSDINDPAKRKAGLICFRFRNKSFLEFIRKIHSEFNPNKIRQS
ncbi:MAG: hypothetical protein Barrevirus39_4, partial [Barrevirus sp.]